MNRRERIAQDLARKSGVTLADYPYGSHGEFVITRLDSLRTVKDEELRQKAWDLYWLLEAERQEASYRFDNDQDEQERRHP